MRLGLLYYGQLTVWLTDLLQNIYMKSFYLTTSVTDVCITYMYKAKTKLPVFPLTLPTLITCVSTNPTNPNYMCFH